jgi:flagellin-like hook-associated protein FlgL
MAIGDIILSRSARSNVLSLANTSKSLDTVQQRLASGKKVNSALDNATVYFAAKGFMDTANAVQLIKDSLGTAIQTLKAATDALSTIDSLLQNAQGLAVKAIQSGTDTAAAQILGQQYDALLTQIRNIATDATFNGVNLLSGLNQNLAINFDPQNTASSLTVKSVDYAGTGTAAGSLASVLGTASTNGWASAADIAGDQNNLKAALGMIRAQAASFGSNSTIITARSDFSTNLVNTLTVASDNLTLADMNEEGANATTLQTRQQLGIISLSISGQASQAVLRLFG